MNKWKVGFRGTAVAAVSLSALTLAGCGNSGTGTNSGNGSSATGSNTVNSSSNTAGNGAKTSGESKGIAHIAYAGSLQLANNKYVGPAFQKQSGYTFQGRGGGSFAVANLIKSGEIQADAFESVGTAPIQALGSKYADWAVGFASSPLVIAYSEKSPFAKQLDAIRKGQKPISDLFTLMEKPSFHLGRTNPQTDPQGQAFVFMMRLAQSQLKLPAGTAAKVLGGVNNSKQIFSETGILSRLQAGQLDATSAYQSEAIQRNLPYIKLPDSINLGNPKKAKLYATAKLKLKNGKTVSGKPLEIYVAALKTAPDGQAADSFIHFVLSQKGLNLYKQNGYQLTPAKVWGNKANIPGSIQSELKQP
ncbi:extracellular solute-binding protein [Alicyclobacillus sp. SO9]|uniref:extracellular solute-binding protein n=1 Tax=Alicyclobacillus sp. SO9 TaxID=2665646 RepID=UPI0018E6E174|nr:extracellular solute-binding protein [Alicyclobacillus sp. SO9]QQE79921.1 substrate-binding domain-containing protein [Alicyclobacillus sp. SO9]